MKIEFTERFDIPSATAQQRGHGAHGKTWESPGLKAARAAWQALFERHRPEQPIKGPLRCMFNLYYHSSGKGRFIHPKTTRPDVDNLAKVINDALMAAGIIAEDSEIWSLIVNKYNWSDPSTVSILIMDWEDTHD